MMFVRTLALLLALSSGALAQSGQMPSGTVWGNPGASKAIASSSTVTAILDRALGSTRGSIIERGASGWVQLGPGATAGLPFVSNGAGTDPGYARLGLVGGGTNADLSATGGASQFLRQNSAGAAITVVRPACADLSNSSASCATDATNATNISTGTLAAGRLPAFSGVVQTSAGSSVTSYPNAAANTLLSNWTSGSAAPTFNTFPSCANDGDHGLVYTNGTGLLCSTILATAMTYTSALTGGVARSVSSKLGESISVTDFGAVCNGSTDDTTAIATAITAAASSKLTLPPGVNCKVKGSGTAIFTILTRMTFDCQGSSLTLDATVPNTRSLFLVSPVAAGWRGGRITNCVLDMNGAGDSTIVINTTATDTTEIGEFEIDHIRDAASLSATGYSILVNNSATNTNGGTFNTNFHDNVLLNGIYLNFAGDSIRIRDSIISGAKYGVYASLIAGAAGLIIEGNNISAADPILLDAVLGPVVISNNEIEQQITNTDPSNAVVDLRGGTATLGLVTMIGNSINALTGTGSPNPLKIANVVAAYVEGNSFVSGVAASSCIVNSGGATTIGAKNTWSGCTTHITNTGTLNYVQVGATP